MGPRTLAVLAVLAALTGGALLLLEGGGPGRKPAAGPWPAGLEPERADALHLLNLDRGTMQEMRFRREGAAGPWRMVDPRQDLADEAQIRQLLAALGQNPWERVGKAGALGEGVLRQMGLADEAGAPSGRGWLEIRSGEIKAEAWLGGPDVDSRLVFVRQGETVWRTQANVWSAFGHNTEEWRSRLLWSLAPLAAGRVVLERAFGRDGRPAQRLELRQDGRGGWLLVEGEFAAPADPTVVASLLGHLAGLRIARFGGDLPADLAAAGLAPPFLRVEIEQEGRAEWLALGEAAEGGVLCRVRDRPYLFLVSLRPELQAHLSGRGVRTPGEGVDFRWLRPFFFPLHAARSLRVLHGSQVALQLERAAGAAGWDLLQPWRAAAREGAVEELLGRLLELRALNSYPVAERPPGETGLDRPELRWEVAADGLPEPRVVLTGKGKGRGVYLGVPEAPVVFFAAGECVAAAAPDPLALVSRLVIRLEPYQFQTVVFERGAGSRRYDRSQAAGGFADPQGRPAEPALVDLVESLADLAATAVVSAAAAEFARQPGALRVRFHRSPPDPARPEPGPVVATLVVAAAGEEWLGARAGAPFVFRLPRRVGAELAAQFGP